MRANLNTFTKTAGWTVSRYMLSKIGSAKHELRFVHSPSGPLVVVRNGHTLARFSDAWLVQGTVDLGALGVLCCSGTAPSIREIVLTAKISDDSPLEWGPNTVLREGFGGPEEFGRGKTYSIRVDFTGLEDRAVKRAELLKLPQGALEYPLRSAGCGVYHPDVYERHEADWLKDEERIGILSDAEREEIYRAFERLPSQVDIDVAVVLDSEELLLFHWRHEQGRFDPDFYNVGLTGEP